ncbi:hypothetical protein CHUAL_002800 [Chamberlinius hualienensis]
MADAIKYFPSVQLLNCIQEHHNSISSLLTSPNLPVTATNSLPKRYRERYDEFSSRHQRQTVFVCVYCDGYRGFLDKNFHFINQSGIRCVRLNVEWSHRLPPSSTSAVETEQRTLCWGLATLATALTVEDDEISGIFLHFWCLNGLQFFWMMTLRTIIGSLASESKEYVETEERAEEVVEERNYEQEHTPDIDLRPSNWLSACTLAGKPFGGAVGHLGMGSCFDFGLHSTTSTTSYNSMTIDDDLIKSRLPSPPSLSEISPPHPHLSSPSTEPTTCQTQEEEIKNKVEREERSMALEKTYVYDVYDQIAPYFRMSRNRTWPKINQFLLDLEPGSLICDAGCGTGKYMDINPDVYPLGIDHCQSLAELAKERGHEVVTCDILALPFRDESFDAAISISVIHHLATTERRVEAIKELARVLRIGGRLVITVWAMEQRHRKFESQDVLVPWHKPVQVSSEDQTSVEKDMTSTTTNSDEDLLHYHAYTSGSEPSVVIPYSIQKRHKFRETWLSRSRLGGNRSNCHSSSQSSSDLSSPNETCYSFLRRALQKLSWGSSESYKVNGHHYSAPWLNPGSNSLDHFGLNGLNNEYFSSNNNCNIESRNRLNSELDKQDSLDSNENADDIPIELYEVDGDQNFKVPLEVSRMRQRRGTSSSDNNVTFKRRISQSFERTASLTDTMLSRRRNKSLKGRLKRSSSTDSPNSHAITHKSRSLSDLLSLFSATFLQYSRKTSQDTTSGSSSSCTKHSSTSSVDSRGSKNVHISKSNLFTLAKVDEGNENNTNNNNIVNNNKLSSSVSVPEEVQIGCESLVDDKNVKITAANRKVRPRSLILSRERVPLRIPRTLSVEDYQNGNHILPDFDLDSRLYEYPQSPTSQACDSFEKVKKSTRDMSTQFDYWSPKEKKSDFESDKKSNSAVSSGKRNSEPCSKSDKQNLYEMLKKNRQVNALDCKFIDKIINHDHLFPCHSMPNLQSTSSSSQIKDDYYKKRNSFVLLSSKAKLLLEMTPSYADGVSHSRHPLNIKGFRRLSQPCMRLGSTARDDCNDKHNFTCDNDSNSDFIVNCGGDELRRNSNPTRWASLMRRHSSFSVMKHVISSQQQVIRHSYSAGDPSLDDSSGTNSTIFSCFNNTSITKHGNSKIIIKEDSLQSDTSVDSDDSVASVIAVRAESSEESGKTSTTPKRSSICSVMKSSSKEGSDTSFDSEESCISVIANEAAICKTQLNELTTDSTASDTAEVDVKWEKYMDASESLALDSIFYVNIVHQPEMELMMVGEDDYYFPGWTTIDTSELDYEIVGLADVKYHKVSNDQSVAEMCWLDSSSCQSCDQEDDLLERQLELQLEISRIDDDLRSFAADDEETSMLKSSCGRLLDAAVDVANSLQSAVTVAVDSSQPKCRGNCNVNGEHQSLGNCHNNQNQPTTDSEDVSNPVLQPPFPTPTVDEPSLDEEKEMSKSFMSNDTSMSISREEADFSNINEGEEKDSFEESHWRVREDVINGNASQAHLKLFQKMLKNTGNSCFDTSMSTPYRRKSLDKKSNRRKSDPDWFRRSSSSAKAKSSSICRGKSLEFCCLPEQRSAESAADKESSCNLSPKIDKLSVEEDTSSAAHHQISKSQKFDDGVDSPSSSSGDQVGESMAEIRRKQRMQTLSFSTSEDSILSGSENCGSTTHHRYYHVFREGELDYLIENYVENLHIISSYYDHSNWCIVAEKVQVWKI